jgi:CRISPR-associated protein Csm2
MATKIDLNYEKKGDIIRIKDDKLFDTVASDWAEAIARTKKTQARNFYDQILILEENIKKNDFASVYPFIKMLNSKVAYGVNRKVVSHEFQDMMTQCLDQITNDEKGEQKFKHFKLFFEAVLGFFKGSN